MRVMVDANIIISAGLFPALLACAIETKVNLLVTGDKDFDEIIVETPKIMKPRKYIKEYIISIGQKNGVYSCPICPLLFA